MVSEQLHPFFKEGTMHLGDIYAFLALTMRYPQPDVFDQDYFDLIETMLEGLEWDHELEALQGWKNSSPDLLDDLQREYTRLFINSAQQPIIAPYASVFMDGDGTLQGKTTEKIHDYFRTCGYEVRDSAEPPDHIQHQLDFLAALAREGRVNETEHFLRVYFRPWFEPFSATCLLEARQPLYKASIQLIDFFTKEEQ